MIKDYRSRVIGTYDFLRAALMEVNREPGRLKQLAREADKRAIALGSSYDPARRYPLDFELTDESTPFQLRAYQYETDHSEVSNDLRVVYGREPLDLTVPMYQTFRVTRAVAPPISYIVPVQWSDVIEVLKAHGLETHTLFEATEIEVESYRFTSVMWPAGPFEGRHMPRFGVEPITQTRMFHAVSLDLPVAPPLASAALNLLDPQSLD